MIPLGCHRPHVVDKTDSQYLGDQHWQQCWFFCVHLFVYVSVCVSAHLFTIIVKFLETQNYWLARFYMWVWFQG